MKNNPIKFPMLRINLPRLWTFRIPLPGGIYLGGGKLILGSLSVVAIGFIAGIFTLINTGQTELVFPDTGASYEVPSMVGSRIIDREFPADRSQTLQINIPAQTRIDVISLKNISLGKFGLTDAFQLTGTSTSDVLTIGTIEIRNSEFPSMDWANGDIFQINATSSVEAAGHTWSPTMSSTTNDVVVGSARGATSYIAEDMVVDRIIIRQSTTGGDVIIGKLILDGVKAWTGTFNADYFEVGTLTFDNVKIGDDGDINSADFTIQSSVKSNNVYDGVIELPIFIR
tara:strand:- start:7278 stop:8132 length:855 start_codon:yes stop_codon:yes gene_type:complete